MNNVISFTPAQLVAFITAIGGAIVTIGAVATLIFKLANRIKAPEVEQNNRLKKLEEENEARKVEIKTLNDRLNDGDSHFKELEQTNKMILRGLQALLRYSLGSENAEALRKTASDLDEYLLEK